MGIDIAGATIVKSAGITFNNSLVFDASGRGSASPIPGYNAWKNATPNSLYYSAVTGWEMNGVSWQSGLVSNTGVFTCPVAGYYALGYNDIHRGGTGIPASNNTYGYAAFCKNGVLTYHNHWNQAVTGGTTSWHTGGHSATFLCAAGDTLALFINRSPSPVGPNSQAQGATYGAYFNGHQCVWCRLIG